MTRDLTIQEADAIIERCFPDEDPNADKLYGITVLDFFMENDFRKILTAEARIALASELLSPPKPPVMFADGMALPHPAGEVVPFRPRLSPSPPSGGDAA